MNNKNTHNEELSLIEFFIKLWDNKLFLFLLTTMLTLLGVLSLYFYNNYKSYEQIDFKYEFKNASRDRYPNEELFDYRIINTFEFLDEVKKSDDEFKNINVEKLVENDKMIIQEFEVLDSDDNVISKHYRIEVPVNVFKNNKYLARKFVRAINNKILDTAREKQQPYANNYITDENDNDLSEYLTYIEVISLIKRQYSELSGKYDKFINDYNDPTLKDNVLVSRLRERLSRWYNNEVYINDLENEVIQEGYVWHELKTAEKLDNIKHIDKKISDNEELLDTYLDRLSDILTNSQGIIGADPILSEISKLIKENHNLKLEKEYYESIETSQGVSKEVQNDNSFDKNIENILTKLSNDTDDFNDLVLRYTNELIRIRNVNSYEFKTIKPLNMPLVSIVVLILSATFSLFVVIIKEQVKDYKRKLSG